MTRITLVMSLVALCLGGQAVVTAAEPTLSSVTISVEAGDNHAAGLNRPEGIATVTLVAKSSQNKLAGVRLAPNSPDTLYTAPTPIGTPCGSAYGSWQSSIAAPDPNTDVSCVFTGTITSCTGGGSGTPPTFQASIVHLDLDVDSDNTSEAITAQKQPADQALGHTIERTPSKADTQEKAEDPQGSEDATNPGLLLVVNHGFEQNPYDVSNPIEDWQRSGTVLDKIDDPDLAKHVSRSPVTSPENSS